MTISTHTLTWSVTSSAFDFTFGCLYFNSHAHVERDLFLTEKNGTRKNFNSHAHVERDDSIKFLNYENYDFNSHAHVERDVDK